MNELEEKCVLEQQILINSKVFHAGMMAIYSILEPLPEWLHTAKNSTKSVFILDTVDLLHYFAANIQILIATILGT